MANKYFLSLSGTFRSFMQGMIKIEDLQSGFFIVGPYDQDALSNENVFPVFVLAFNKQKPKYLQEVQFVDKQAVDEEVITEWQKFKGAFRNAIIHERVQWADGNNYPAKGKPFVDAGHMVFFDGHWLTVAELKYLEHQ